MKSNDIVKQAAEIVLKTEEMVKHAHYLLRNNEIDQGQFLEVKKLEMKAQKLYQKLKDESR
jgi:hypothetical protein